MSVLTTLVSVYVYEARTQAKATSNFITSAKARAAAEAGINVALYELMRRRHERSETHRKKVSFELDDIRIEVAIEDESGKIDINRAPLRLLQGLLESQGLSQDRSAALSAAIVDWRDQDEKPLPLGAEVADYAAEGLERSPRNGPFLVVEELLQVLGMQGHTVQKLLPYITVYGRQPGINPAAADEAVLRALPGVEAKAVDSFLAARLDSSRRRPPALDAPSRLLARGGGRVYTLRAKIVSPNGAVSKRIATVQIIDPTRGRYFFHRWIENPRR